MDVAIGRAVLTSLRAAELLVRALGSSRNFLGFYFLGFFIRESWRGLAVSQILLAGFLLSCSWPWSLH